jgi:uncharacterized membrane protein YcaP (DUF421 family)
MLNWEMWEWAGRAVAILFIMILWVRTSAVKTFMQLSYLEASLGMLFVVMGAIIMLFRAIPFPIGITTLALFGVISRLVIRLTTQTLTRSTSAPSTSKSPIYTFILDGQLLPSALTPLGKDSQWVNQILANYGIPSIDGVAIAQIDQRNRIIISRKGSSEAPTLLH